MVNQSAKTNDNILANSSIVTYNINVNGKKHKSYKKRSTTKEDSTELSKDSKLYSPAYPKLVDSVTNRQPILTQIPASQVPQQAPGLNIQQTLPPTYNRMKDFLGHDKTPSLADSIDNESDTHGEINNFDLNSVASEEQEQALQAEEEVEAESPPHYKLSPDKLQNYLSNRNLNQNQQAILDLYNKTENSSRKKQDFIQVIANEFHIDVTNLGLKSSATKIDILKRLIELMN